MRKKINNLKNFQFNVPGLDRSEREWGISQFNTYLELYPHLNKLSDVQLLNELVFLEILQERFRTAMNEFRTKALKDAEAGKTVDPNKVPRYLQDQLSSNLEQILTLKEKLGMFEEKKKLDAYQDIKNIFAKFRVWREQNQALRKCTCPFCAKIFFLKIRTDRYEEIKFPFFQDKVLCNEELHKIYKAGQITKEQYASVLGTSSDYIDWLDEKFFGRKVVTDPSTETPQS
jgi:hypothetical protein